MKDDNKELVRDLVLIDEGPIDAVALFTGDELDRFLQDVADRVRALVPDVTTAKGRKEIASTAYKVSQVKVRIDGTGKDLTEEHMTVVNKINGNRKGAREFLDALRDEIRGPLTTWEAAEEIRLAEEQKRKEIADAEDTAWAMHDMWLREKELKAREAAIAKAEAEQRAAAEKAEAERHEREEAERQKELEARLEKDRQAAEERRIQEAKEEAFRAVEAARLKAEQDHAEALQKAEEEKQQAIRDAKAEAEQKEAARLAAEEAKKQEDLKRKRDIEHRKNINREALYDLITFGMIEENAKELIQAIVKGNIAHIQINY